MSSPRLKPQTCTSRRTGSAARYRHFWTDVGAHFPDLGGARSTAQYLEDEKWLFRRYFSPLNGRRILKTELCLEIDLAIGPNRVYKDTNIFMTRMAGPPHEPPEST